MGGWRYFLAFLLVFIVSTADATCPQDTPDRYLLCYQTKYTEQERDPCLCTHWVLPRELIEEKDYLLEKNEDLQFILSVETGEANVTQDLFFDNLQGIELSTVWRKEPKLLVKYIKSIVEELHNYRGKRSYSVSEYDSADFIDNEDDLTTATTDGDEDILKTTVTTAKPEAKSTASAERIIRDNIDQGPILALRLPSNAMQIAKHYDLKSLSKYVDLFILNTDNIVESKQNVTFHPSRLMGINDIHNADSLVDLITGLGIRKDKLILSMPSYAFQFQLSNSSLNLPQSPALGAPKLLTQSKLCKMTKEGNWTIERDEDLTAPYAFQNNTWIAFDDEMSASIKSKYIALSNLAGAAIMDVQALDWSSKCSGTGASILKAVHETFTVVSRKPRQTQLLELQQQLHEHSLDSPTRVVRVVDHDGATHVVRRDVVTNFQCSRQGYFVHPSGCNRFYRCVKFNQYTDDFTVFEYDCPAGLAFDERWEVCVWPGSLPDGGACQGSSEIAPVPRNRFQCPRQPGYYADPENCRWFFACLDHVGDGVTPLTAYEFRCPFSLVFNEQTLVCDWPWNVQGCGTQGVGGARFTYGDLLEGRLKPSYATVPDHLVSGGRIENANDAGNILGTYYGSNGVVDINAPSESQLKYGGSYKSGSAGAGQYSTSGEKGSYTSGSSQYGQYAGNQNSGAYRAGQDNGAYRAGQDSGAYVAGQGSGAHRAGQDSGAYVAGQGSGAHISSNGAYVTGQNGGSYRGGQVGGGSYFDAKYPGDSGDDGSYREDKYNNGQYIHQDVPYVHDSHPAIPYAHDSHPAPPAIPYTHDKHPAPPAIPYVHDVHPAPPAPPAVPYIPDKYPGDSGSYSGSGGHYVASSYPGSQDGQYKGSYSAGSDNAGAYVAKGVGAGDKYYGAAAGYNAQGNGEYVASSYSGSKEGQYKGSYSDNSGAYKAGGAGAGGKYYGAAAGYNVQGAGQYSGSGQYSSKYSGESGQYSSGALPTAYSGSYVSTTAAPIVSSQAGQYSSGAVYSGPSINTAFQSEKSILHHAGASQGYSTPSTIAFSTTTPRYEPVKVSSTTPQYNGISGAYSGVSLSGERFGVNGESGHIPIQPTVYSGFDNLAFQVNSLHPSLSPNVLQGGYSTSGNVFFSPTPTSGGFSSYSPVSYSTPAPTTYYPSTTASSVSPIAYSSILPQKSYVSSTPSPVQYSSYSPAQSTGYTTASPAPFSYSTPKPVSYVPFSPTPAPYSPSVASYSSAQASYTPAKVYAPSTTPSPTYISYSTPAPKTYYPTTTPAPIIQYTPVAPSQIYNSFGSSQYSSFSDNSARLPLGTYPQSYSSFQSGYAGQQYTGPIKSPSYEAGQSVGSYKSTAAPSVVKYTTPSPLSYSTTEKGSYASSTAVPVAYSTSKPSYQAGQINTYSSAIPSAYPSADYSGQTFLNRFDAAKAISSKVPSQTYSGDEYLPPLESAPSAYGIKKPCDHAAPAYISAPSQTFLSSGGYEFVKYSSPSYPAPSYAPSPTYSSESLVYNPIVVQPLPDVSSFKDYFYSSVLPSSYPTTPGPTIYSSTPAYFSSAGPISYSSTPKAYVSSTTPTPIDLSYVSSYSTPKPIVYSTTASPVVSSYSTPKPYVSTTASPVYDYSFASTYSPNPISYSTTGAPISYTFSTPAPASSYESKVYQYNTPSPVSYAAPSLVYEPSRLQPIKTYQSTATYDVQPYTATPRPCDSNSLDIDHGSRASDLPDGTYVVGIKKQDKVVIVSRLSDFNPLLVEKLGATCDCQSQSQPIKVVRRRKIKSTTENYDSFGTNSVRPYNAYQTSNSESDLNSNIDIVSYNTREEAEQSQVLNEKPTTQKKLYSSKKVTPTFASTTEENIEEHDHDDKLSITEFGTIECKRAGLFRHPKQCNKFYQCNWDEWKKKFTLHEFKCPIHLAYDTKIGACNWPSKGPACSNDNLLV